jgi:hypothetical protein
MHWHPQDILAALDKCAEHFTFPMLDNGYVYPAATRLSLYRSTDDWGMVIEIFGFSPRAGLPDIHIYTFASQLVRAKSEIDYVSRQAYESYLANNQHNESTFVYPIEEGEWQDTENSEFLASGATKAIVRGEPMDTPPLQEYGANGITLQEPPNIYVFEFCRLLAATTRGSVLATTDERRRCLPAELDQILQLEEWNHPDLGNGELPSANATFRSLAEVLSYGTAETYQPKGAPNTHWSNWPEGGTL